MTAPEHDPAVEAWGMVADVVASPTDDTWGLRFHYDPHPPEQTYPRPEPGTVVPIVRDGEVIGTATWSESIPTEASVKPDRLWVIPQFAERGLVMPDRWEGDDS